MNSISCDFLVIGGGSGGVRAARVAAQLGAEVYLVEGGRLGGTCVNVGCVPKKLFLYASEFSKSFVDAVSYGWEASEPAFNWAKLIANKDREINRLNGIYQSLLENAGVKIIKGWADFVDEHTVRVGEKRLKAKHILIATGGTPRRPTFSGNEHVLISDDVFELAQLPKRLLVLGGGYIAVEFACILKGLGVDVTLAYRGPLFLRGFDQDVRQHVAQEMANRGINLKWNSLVDSITAHGDEFEVTFKDHSKAKFDLVFSAIGRDPLVSSLGLENAQVKTNGRGAIVVDEQFRTSQPHIFAVGDVIDRIQLTPVALAEGMRVANALYGDHLEPLDYDMVPSAVFSQPTIGSCGMTEEQARKAFPNDVEVYRSVFTPLKYTLTERKERALVKLIVQKSTNRVVGLHLASQGAAEITQGFAVAMQAGLTKKDFDRTIGIHPTLAEELVTMRTPL